MKPRARIIMTVWGEGYLTEMLEVTLPAVVAPGNLPALAELVECEYVLVTESAFFDRIRATPIFQRIEAVCSARLVSLDDLVMTRNHYGMTLTHAFCRGFEDLGAAMTDCHLIFLNGDFILADGSWRNLARKIVDGHSLVVAPSYCAIKERVEPILRKRMAAAGEESLVIPQRELAALTIPNRHYTIRGKTVNQQLFSMGCIEQFYWYVDDCTLLAHQMPIAVVCLKPEQALTELKCFWDYGLISELAPTTKPYVFDDSDDFLMMELRSENTYTESLAMGWPTAAEISANLGGFVTKDHVDYGRYSLVLHSRDLPPTVPAARKKLRAFVDRVFAGLPSELISWRDHPYWQASLYEFERARAEWWRRHEKEDDESEGDQEPVTLAEGAPAALPDDPGPRLLVRLYHAILGMPPRVKASHPRWVDFQPCVEACDEVLKSGAAKTLIVSSPFSEHMLSRLVVHAPGRFARVDAFTADNDLLDTVIRGEGDFDLCLMDLDFADVLRLPRMYRSIRPRMKRGGRVVACFINSMALKLEAKDLMLIKTIFPATDSSRISFSGSKLSAFATRLLRFGVRLRARRKVAGSFGFVLFAGSAILLSLASNRCGALPNLRRLPMPCTGMTVVIDVH